MSNGFGNRAPKRSPLEVEHEDPTTPIPDRSLKGMPSDFIVTIIAKGRPRRVVWDSAHPLKLDHPVTRFIEEADGGLQVSSVDPAKEPIFISEEQVRTGATIPVGNFEIQLKRIRKANPGFVQHVTKGIVTSSASGLYLASGYGESFLSFKPMPGSAYVRLGNLRVARFGRASGGIRVEALVEGVTLGVDDGSSVGSSAQTLVPRQPRIISGQMGTVFILRLDQHWWRLGQSMAPVIAGVENPPIFDSDAESEFFGKSLRALVASVAVFGLLLYTNIIPKPKPPEQAQAKGTTVQLRKIVKKAPPKKEEKVVAKKPEPPKPKEKPKKVAEAPKKKPEKKPEKKMVQKPGPKKPEKKMAKASPKPPIAQKPAPAPKVLNQPPVKGPPAAAPKGKMIALPNAGPPPPRRNMPTPSQIQAAQAQARLSKSLGFLSSGPKAIAGRNMAVATVQSAHSRYQAINTVTTAVAQAGSGGGYLSKVASTVGGNGSAAIGTKNARGMSSDAGVVGGYGPGGRGKGLNEVQGKVSLNALYDPNAGDGMGSSLGGGGLSLSGEGKIPEGLLMKVLEKYMQKFQYCYEKALLTNASLAGTLILQWTISPGGRASNIKVVRSQLNNNALHQCVSNELSRVPFPSPSGGSVTVKFPFAFSSSAL